MKFLLPLVGAAIGTPLLGQTVTTSATPPVAAPAATAAASQLVTTRSIMDTLFAAGPVMIFLFALSVFFVMLVIVYWMTIRRGAVVLGGFMASAEAMLSKRYYIV